LISADALKLFESMYLTQQRLSVKTCWQNICYVNKDQDKGWKVPKLPFMYRYVKGQIPLGIQVLHREGLAAYEAKCAPYIQVDPDSIEPGQVWVGDHSQFNCWIRHRGRWIRPWITAWEDMRSRMIVGCWISASPNQTTILLAMKRALEKYGPPDSAKIDNGRDYDSQCWTGTTKAKRRALTKGYIDEQMVAGIYAMMGVGVSFSIKYHPQSKSIERFFDTLDRQFTKTVPTYCGKDSDRKPDYLNDLLKSEKAINEAYSLESFADMTGRYIEAYNNTAHSGGGMEGRSPAEVFASRASRRVMVEGVLELLLRVWSGELTVGKNGVRFKKMWFGQYDMELAVHQGKKVRVSYDPDDLRCIYVYDSVTLKLITIAEQNELIQYGSQVSEEDLRNAMHKKSRALRIARDYRDSQLTANMDLTSLTIKALQDGQKKPAGKTRQAKTRRPVRTPLDGQVREHERREILKAVKKAAGAESTEKVLDFDFSLLKNESRTVDLELFDHG
jgi:transposase InsO family protein